MRRKERTSLWTRRRFGGAIAAAAAGLSVRRASADEGKPSILIVGDSMIAGGFGLFLEQALRKEHGYDVRRLGKSSTGLARPDFYNWMKVAQAIVDDEPADASIVMFGGNDVQGLWMGKDEWIRWPEDDWSQEYARRVDAFADILSPPGRHLFWIGLPVMRPAKFRARCVKVNTIYRAEMAIRPDSTFIDTWSVLTNGDGEYADKIVLEPPPEGKRPKKTRVRAGDGIHLSPAGAHHLVEYVLGKLLPALDEI
jgi:hypothetical protein